MTTQTFFEIDNKLYGDDWTRPTSKTFRNAWEVTDPDSKVIQINMESAKEIWRTKIRSHRKAALEKLDAEFMKALESGADTAEIVAKKQNLRDAPAHADIDAATTPEELTAFQPIPDVIIK